MICMLHAMCCNIITSATWTSCNGYDVVTLIIVEPRIHITCMSCNLSMLRLCVVKLLFVEPGHHVMIMCCYLSTVQIHIFFVFHAFIIPKYCITLLIV